MATPNTKLPILYAFFRSSCSWRVRLALAAKNIPYEIKPINLLLNENKTEEYKKIQPFGAVPAFIDTNGAVLVESVAIIEYLDETRPEFPLLPKDPLDRATVRALVQAIAMDIQPVCSIRILRHVNQPENEWSKHFITIGFEAYEKMLEKTAGVYSFGDTITMADLLLIPQFYNGVRAEVDMTAYPIISRIHNTLSQIDKLKAAHPLNQPDCPTGKF
ncbi:Glutathione S-transferase zeta-1 [Entomortierella beljakovae]|nr:Glutathione S-transferase zeta-1 [Entomortierella beljakovae]